MSKKQEINVATSVVPLFDEKLSADDTVVRAIFNNVDVVTAIQNEQNHGLVSMVNDYQRTAVRNGLDNTEITRSAYGSQLGIYYENARRRWLPDEANVIIVDTLAEVFTAAAQFSTYFIEDGRVKDRADPFGLAWDNINGVFPDDHTTHPNKHYLMVRKVPDVGYRYMRVGQPEPDILCTKSLLRTPNGISHHSTSVILPDAYRGFGFNGYTMPYANGVDGIQFGWSSLRFLGARLAENLNGMCMGSLSEVGGEVTENNPCVWLLTHYTENLPLDSTDLWVKIYYADEEPDLTDPAWQRTVVWEGTLNTATHKYVQLPQTRDIILEGGLGASAIWSTELTASEHWFRDWEAIPWDRLKLDWLVDKDLVAVDEVITNLKLKVLANGVVYKELVVGNLEETQTLTIDEWSASRDLEFTYIITYTVTTLSNDPDLEDTVIEVETLLSESAVNDFYTLNIDIELADLPITDFFVLGMGTEYVFNKPASNLPVIPVEFICEVRANNNLFYSAKFLGMPTSLEAHRANTSVFRRPNDRFYTGVIIDLGPSRQYVSIVQNLDNPTYINPQWGVLTEKYLKDNNLLSNSPFGSAVPSAPFITGKKRVTGDKAAVVKKTLRAFKIDPKEVQDGLYELPEDFDGEDRDKPENVIQEAWLNFAVDVMSTREGTVDYLFQLFEDLNSASLNSAARFTAWKANPLGKTAYREVLTIREGGFNRTISWHYITKTTKPGTVIQGFRHAHWTATNERVIFSNPVYIDSPNSGPTMVQPAMYSEIEGTELRLRRNNKNEETYDEIIVYGLITSHQVYKNRVVTQTLRTASNADARMYVPLLWSTVKKIRYRERRQICYHAMNISVFHVHVRDKAWYEANWVRWAVVIITVTIAVTIFVVSLGAGTPASVILLKMGISAFVGWAVLKGLVWLTEKLGITNSFILAIIVIAAITAMVLTGNFKLTTALELLKLSVKHLEAVAIVSAAELADLRLEMEDLLKNYEEKKADLDERWDELNNDTDWLGYLGSGFIVDFNESPDQFIGRCLMGADSTRLSLELIPNFVDAMLELPKVKHEEVTPNE